ncbi:MAG: hypothetical protein ABI091_07055 [Ferruginibacter sp.]
MKTLTKIFIISLLSITGLIKKAEARQISVVLAGAYPDDGIDDKQAIQLLINYVSVGDTIIFPTGVYNLGGDGSGSPTLYLKNDVYMDGQGSTLDCKSWGSIFGMYGINNVTIKNFKGQWDNDLPFSGGTVVAKGSTYIDVAVKGNNPIRNGMNVESFFKFDSTNMRPATNGYDLYQVPAPVATTTTVSPGVMRCPVSAGNLPYFVVGDNVVVRFRDYGGDFFSIINSSNIAVMNTIIYSMPGMAFYSRSSTNLTLDSIIVDRKPGYWLSTCADGFHFDGDRGAVNVNNCHLTGMGDDGVNVHGLYSKITALTTNTITIVDANSGNILYDDYDPKVGDSLEIINTTTMALVKKICVAAVTRNATNTTIAATQSFTGVAVNQFVSNISKMPIATITGTSVLKNRARGLILQCRNATISNCILSENSMPGILVETSAKYFFETVSPRNIVIKNSIINNCNYWNAGYPGSITIRAINGTGAIAPAGVVNNISILDSWILGSYNKTDDRVAISINSADSIALRGNTFSGFANEIVKLQNTGYNIYVNTADPSTASTPKTTAVNLPAIIYAENVDNGGQTIAYFERTVPANNPNPTADLIQTATATGVGTYVKNLERNEWMQYSVNVPVASSFQLKINCGSGSINGSKFHLEQGHNNFTGSIAVGNTGTAFTVVDGGIVSLPAGTYPLRLVVDSGILFIDTLSFTAYSILPVNIISVSANAVNKNINVEWKVENERNVKEYIVEKSADGNNFNKVSFVQSNNKGTDTYNWLDTNPLTGFNYYRITRIDENNQKSLSQIVKVSMGTNSNNGISVYPVPIVNGAINLQLMNEPGGKYFVRVLNQLGQPVLSKQIIHAEGNSSEIIQMEKNSSHGIYTVEITKPNGELTSIKILN